MLTLFLISVIASIVGSICGIGGGILMKPLMDSMKLMSVSSINFLSGCTVLSMSIISVSKTIKKNRDEINIKLGTPLAIGAALGGIVGKILFQIVYQKYISNKIVVLQAVILILLVIGTLVYTICGNRIRTRNLQKGYICIIVGIFLGILSSFLGIGGGPFNLVVLSYFFSMNTKQAAANSLYIILFSQISSLFLTIFTNNIPNFHFLDCVIMVLGGVCGGILGSRMNRKISDRGVNFLFCSLMVVLIGINIYNVIIFISQ